MWRSFFTEKKWLLWSWGGFACFRDRQCKKMLLVYHLYYANKKWNVSQEKTNRNQPPVFDIFDDTGNSYADTTVYDASTFTGTKIFSYKQGMGKNDTELGIPISYRSISNVGDIVFNFDLLQDSFTYSVDNDW